VLGKDGKVVPNVYCIGDANGKYMLAHAASAQVRRGAVTGYSPEWHLASRLEASYAPLSEAWTLAGEHA
jgi:hypothetical protein